MYDKPMLSLMADHNRWMNEKLYAVCAGIPDEARKRDLGAFLALRRARCRIAAGASPPGRRLQSDSPQPRCK